MKSILNFRMLEYVQDNTLFTVLCLVIRGFEALGASAYSTASYVFVVNSFPQNIGSVLVKNLYFFMRKILLYECVVKGHIRNLRGTRNEHRTGSRRASVFGTYNIFCTV